MAIGLSPAMLPRKPPAAPLCRICAKSEPPLRNLYIYTTGSSLFLLISSLERIVPHAPTVLPSGISSRNALAEHHGKSNSETSWEDRTTKQLRGETEQVVNLISLRTSGCQQFHQSGSNKESPPPSSRLFTKNTNFNESQNTCFNRVKRHIPFFAQSRN